MPTTVKMVIVSVSLLLACVINIARMVRVSIIRHNRTEWSLIRPVILWTITGKQNQTAVSWESDLLNPLKSIITGCQLGRMFYYRFPCLTSNPLKSVCAIVCAAQSLGSWGPMMRQQQENRLKSEFALF